MYTREISEAPDKLIKKSKAIFGTFKGHPKFFDIRGIRKPFGTWALPLFVTDTLIKSKMAYYFYTGSYIGCIFFVDAKILEYVEVVFWDIETHKRYSYHCVTGPQRQFIPFSLEAASTSCFAKSRYIRFSWDRRHNRLSLILNLKGDKNRPEVHAVFSAKFDERSCELTQVMPSPNLRRCTASYDLVQPLKGDLNIIEKNETVKNFSFNEGISFFNMKRLYMTLHYSGETIIGMGKCNEKNLLFKLHGSSQEIQNQEKMNDNFMIYDGRIIPLPPVVITHSYGIDKNWVIQDTENMIDLTFTPLSDNLNKVSILILRSIYHKIYGKFEGTLNIDNEEKLTFRSLPGLAEKYLVRL